jgi:hypothetical protein
MGPNLFIEPACAIGLSRGKIGSRRRIHSGELGAMRKLVREERIKSESRFSERVFGRVAERAGSAGRAHSRERNSPAPPAGNTFLWQASGCRCA